MNVLDGFTVGWRGLGLELKLERNGECDRQFTLLVSGVLSGVTVCLEIGRIRWHDRNDTEFEFILKVVSDLPRATIWTI